jgi:hypothetical protein
MPEPRLYLGGDLGKGINFRKPKGSSSPRSRKRLDPAFRLAGIAMKRFGYEKKIMKRLQGEYRLGAFFLNLHGVTPDLNPVSIRPERFLQ